MSAWEALGTSGALTVRALGEWPGRELTKERRPSPFDTPLPETLRQLLRELRHLGAERVVMELAITEADLRLDGLPRASARASHPGVVLSFQSAHGPLRYHVDAFTSWQANLRAIVLGLESLRRVSRYGMGAAGEQYRGWRALDAHAGGEEPQVERGRLIIDRYDTVAAALKATHPDRGGNRDDFAAVQAARGA